MSRLVSDLRRVAMRVVVALALAFTPWEVPHWRRTVEAPPAVVLPVGEPVPALRAR